MPVVGLDKPDSFRSWCPRFLCVALDICGIRDELNDMAPMSPVSVDVLSMPITAALDMVSGGGETRAWERVERDAPVTFETLLARLFRPEALEMASAKGIVPSPQGQ